MENAQSSAPYIAPLPVKSYGCGKVSPIESSNGSVFLLIVGLCCAEQLPALDSLRSPLHLRLKQQHRRGEVPLVKPLYSLLQGVSYILQGIVFLETILPAVAMVLRQPGVVVSTAGDRKDKRNRQC